MKFEELVQLCENTNQYCFASAVLDSADHEALIKAFPPIHPTVFAHHATLYFSKAATPELISKYQALAGQQVEIIVTGYAEDDKGQAVTVEIANCQNEIPHITISCAKGVAPVYSNQLLKTASIKQIQSFNLTGKIEVKMY